MALNMFIAVGNGANTISTSTNGTTWVSQNTSGNFCDIASNGLSGANLRLVAVGDHSISYSTNGTTWTAVSITGFLNANYLKVIYANGYFYVVANLADSPNTTRIIRSINGTAWQNLITTNYGNDLYGQYDIIYDGTQLITVGNNSSFTSPDGITWTYHSMPSGNYNKIIYNGVAYVAITTNGTDGSICYSENGTTWRKVATFGELNDIIWTGNEFVTVGNNKYLSYSSNGRNWNFFTISGTTTFANYKKVLFTNSELLAIGGGSTTKIAKAPLYGSWSNSLTINSGFYLYDIIWTGTQYIAVGDATCITSPDANSWTFQTIPSGNYKRIIYA